MLTRRNLLPAALSVATAAGLRPAGAAAPDEIVVAQSADALHHWTLAAIRSSPPPTCCFTSTMPW